MTDNRQPAPTLATLDAPLVDQSRFRGRPGVDRPVAAPSLWEGVSAVFHAADDAEGQGARENEALHNAYTPIIAELNRRGVTSDAYTHFDFREPSYRALNEDAIWQGIARARALDKSAFEGIGSTPQQFRDRTVAPLRARAAQTAATAGRAGWTARTIGELGYGLGDPINVATMAFGAGPARSLAQAALRGAGFNVALTALTEPQKIIEGALDGREVTARDVAGDVAGAAALGGVLPLVGHGAGAIGKSVWGRTAAAMREHIGTDRMTGEERAATDALDRVDETAATSPFQPGTGTDAHLDRMDRALATLDTPPVPRETSAPVPQPTAPPPAAPASAWAATPFASVKDRILGPESRGDYGVVVYHEAAPRPITGMSLGEVYDFQKGPLRARTRGRRGPNDIGSTGMGAYQFESETLRQTARSLYGDDWRSHPFSPATQDALAERLWNSVRDKPALLRNTWAAFAPGRDETVPVLRREQFGSDGEWQAAQAELEAATREETAAQVAATERPPASDDPFDPRGWDDQAAPSSAAAAARDWSVEPPLPVSPRERWMDAVDRLTSGRDLEVSGALEHPAIGPIDAKMGQAGDPARNFANGYGLAHILAKHPEMADKIEQLPDIIAAMGIQKDDGRTIRLESGDHAAGVRLDWDGLRQRWLVTAYEKGRTPAAPVSTRDAAGGGASPAAGR